MADPVGTKVLLI